MVHLNAAVDRATMAETENSDSDEDTVSGSDLIEACTGPLSRKIGELVVDDLLERHYRSRQMDTELPAINVFALPMETGGKVLRGGVRKPAMAHPDGANVRWIPEVSVRHVEVLLYY